MSSLSLDARGVLSYAQDTDEPLTVDMLKAQGWSERRSRAALRELAAANLLTVTQIKGANGRYQQTTYSLNVNDGADADVRTVESVGTDTTVRTVKNAAAVSNAHTPAYTHERELKAFTNINTTPPPVLRSEEQKTAVVVFDDPDDGAPRPEIFAVYENAFGPLTAYIAQELKTLANDFPGGWLEDAFRIAQENNRRTLAYVRGILNRWQTEGRDTPAKPKGIGPLPRNGKPRISTVDAFLSEDELNAMRPTGTEYLVTYAQ